MPKHAPTVDPRLLGYIHRPEAAQELRREVQQAYGAESSMAAQWTGQWEKLKAAGQFLVAPFLYEKQVYDKILEGRHQRRGTCVEQGIGTAVQAQITFKIGAEGAAAAPIRAFVGHIYYLSRKMSGIRGSDGAVGSHFCAQLWKHGWVPVGTYQGQNCDPDNEKLITGIDENPGQYRALLDELLEIGKNHPVRPYLPEKTSDVLDGLAARFGGSFCKGRLNSRRNADGVSRTEGNGAHNEQLCGVACLEKYGDVVLHQQSWGTGSPGGPRMITLENGEKVELPPQVYALPLKDFENQWGEGDSEVMLFDLDSKGLKRLSAAEIAARQRDQKNKQRSTIDVRAAKHVIA